MSSAEISEWLAWDQLDHLPDHYWIGGEICATIANVMGNGRRTFHPEHFVPRAKAVKIASADDMLVKFRAISTAQNEREKQATKQRALDSQSRATGTSRFSAPGPIRVIYDGCDGGATSRQ